MKISDSRIRIRIRIGLFFLCFLALSLSLPLCKIVPQKENFVPFQTELIGWREKQSKDRIMESKQPTIQVKKGRESIIKNIEQTNETEENIESLSIEIDRNWISFLSLVLDENREFFRYFSLWSIFYLSALNHVNIFSLLLRCFDRT